MKIVNLVSDNYKAEINLSRGANCISLKNSKYNADILNEPDYSRLDNPYIYGMPILFPANRISNGEFMFEGRKYKFPVNESKTGCHLHGMLHETEFSAEEISVSRILCRYSSKNSSVYSFFQHEFEILMEYELSEQGLMHRTTVINNSDKNMPYLLGFHTSFNISFTNNTSVENVLVYADISKEFERDDNYLPTGKELDFDEVSQKLSCGELDAYNIPLSRHYLAGNAGNMVLYDKENDLSVVYTNDKKFKYRLIFNGASDGYICLEPQSCLVNCPNSPLERSENGFDYIKSLDSKTFISGIYITEGDMRLKQPRQKFLQDVISV
ncbi:MAG: aldose 1-epimerase [Clostridia bacterium]|nr:aldose 1-epimerase [Clostridia bacterium]